MYRDIIIIIIIREPDIYHKEGYTCSSFRERDLSPGCCPSHLPTPALPRHLDAMVAPFCSGYLGQQEPPGERRERYARMSTLSSLHRPFFLFLSVFLFSFCFPFFFPFFAFRLCIFASFSAENCQPGWLAGWLLVLFLFFFFLFFPFCTFFCSLLAFLPSCGLDGGLTGGTYVLQTSEVKAGGGQVESQRG